MELCSPEGIKYIYLSICNTQYWLVGNIHCWVWTFFGSADKYHQIYTTL